jgi:hypothetical protein
VAKTPVVGPGTAAGTGVGAGTGTESDSASDSLIHPDVFSASTHAPPAPGGLFTSSISQPGLSSIAERHSGSGEDSDDGDDEDEGIRTVKVQGHTRGSANEGVIKSGYLWKKGERRKVR